MYFYTPRIQCFGGGIIGINLTVRLSISLISTTDESILINLYTVAIYNLKICMKDDNPCLNYFKGDNYAFCDLRYVQFYPI